MSISFDMVTTRTGDGGKSTDYTGRQDWKDAPVFSLLGDLDELGSWLGVVKHLGKYRAELESAQSLLLAIGSLVATEPMFDEGGNPTEALYARLRPVNQNDIDTLEDWERRLMDRVTLKPVFVLTGGTKKAAWCDVARTVCRRAERSLVGFLRANPRPDLIAASRWINRLSDVLFVLARLYSKD